MFGTIAWKVTSRLAVAASSLPRPLYFRILSYGLQPLLDLARGRAPGLAREAEIARPSAALANDARDDAGTATAPPVTPGRRRALVIDGFTPTPDRDAASVDVVWFMRILLGLGYDVMFVPAFSTAYAGRYTDDLRALGIVCPVAPALASAQAFVTTHGAAFDLIALYRISVADGLIDVVRKHAPRAKLVFNTVDLHFLRDQRQAELNGQLHAFVEAKGREARELAVIRAADAAVLLSEFEYDYIGRHAPDAHRVFIPLAMPVPGRLASYEGREGALFVGGFAHAPNVDAVHFLCGTIWPLVRRLLPDATLFIVGANPPADVAAYHAPSAGIEIMGYVEDLSALYNAVRVSVAPLRFGAGLKGKVVASLAAGLPSVATAVGAEGLPPGGAGAIAVADDPAAFARAIADIHSSRERWLRMSDAGTAYARENFSVDAVRVRVEAMLKSLGL
jgi:glycosyltransferase involved in cell wall biosynthesis